ncbi:serine hydrolase [Actinoplanes sp. OR16]|uniref:serine hydrolase domain-containing protein n=1 Tax=Actinoplanes sp. OR16 TaxID=946334 RepID=UPI000F6E488B|nr:serine hydrolase domain-containing protein [Actinoplanes sp. OR16]BBH70692.1 serine hydrolase [Actinoplanes sp. OR16]
MGFVRGTVAPGFETVREEFAAFLSEEPAATGSQLAAYHRGVQVVDLWGDDVGGDTLTGVFSVSKGAAHLVVALLVQDGVLDLDAPARSLPFPLSVRELLGHRSGLIGVDGGFSVEEAADDRLVAERLAGQKPYWAPGDGYGYHALTVGALIDAELRAVTGRSVQQWYASLLRDRFGLELWLGLPEELEPRFRPLLPAAGPAFVPDPASLMAVAFNTARFDLLDYGNTREVRALGASSGGGVGNARGVAGLYAAALRLLGGDTITTFSRPYAEGSDLVTGEIDHFRLGFENLPLTYPFLGRRTIGHGGAAGSLGWADPDAEVAYGYVRRRFGYPGTENARLGEAVITAALGR